MLASLRSQLALSNLLITLLGLLIVVVVLTQVIAERSRAIKQQELATQSQQVAHQVERLFTQRGSVQDLEQQIDFESQLLGERIIVVNRQGLPVSHLDSAERTPYYRGKQYQANQRALHNGQSFISYLQSRNQVVFQSPVHGTVNHQVEGAILLVAPTADVQPSLASLIGVIGIAVLVALLVWLAIGLYFTYSISRPLLRITHATERMAHGDYSVRVPARGHGEIARLALSYNDMAQKVQQSSQVLRDFVANVSHDLRTPLTMVTGFSQALLDGTARPEEVETSAAVIHDEAAKMQRMVDDLLQLTRLEAGLYQLERHPIALRPFVQSVVDRVARQKPAASLENLVPVEMPAIDVDPDRLERALRNLLENAVQYTPASGTVTVRAQAVDQRWVEIAVCDTGVGIAPHDLPRIFERFYRSDRSRERGQGHSGLGLAIAREIVEAHGGRLTVDSELGRGSTFRVAVPRADVTPEPEAVAPVPARQVLPR